MGPPSSYPCEVMKLKFYVRQAYLSKMASFAEVLIEDFTYINFISYRFIFSVSIVDLSRSVVIIYPLTKFNMAPKDLLEWASYSYSRRYYLRFLKHTLLLSSFSKDGKDRKHGIVQSFWIH